MTTVTVLADVDVCNMGLSHLGISTQIQSINPPDNTEQAKLAAFWYPKSRDQLLKSAPWDFAYTSVVLQTDPSLAGASGTIGGTYAFPGWPYAYVYPNDCLQAIAVTTYAGQRLGPAFWSSWWWPTSGFTYSIPKIPYKIVQSQANPGQKMILCDVQSASTSPIYLFYIQCVTNTALFDSMFADALGFDLGWRIGMGLRSANPQKVQYCQAMAKQMRLEALAQVLNQSQQDQEADSPSTKARW
jgi:hypothetical protein